MLPGTRASCTSARDAPGSCSWRRLCQERSLGSTGHSSEHQTTDLFTCERPRWFRCMQRFSSTESFRRLLEERQSLKNLHFVCPDDNVWEPPLHRIRELRKLRLSRAVGIPSISHSLHRLWLDECCVTGFHPHLPQLQALVLHQCEGIAEFLKGVALRSRRLRKLIVDGTVSALVLHQFPPTCIIQVTGIDVDHHKPPMASGVRSLQRLRHAHFEPFLSRFRSLTSLDTIGVPPVPLVASLPLRFLSTIGDAEHVIRRCERLRTLQISATGRQVANAILASTSLTSLRLQKVRPPQTPVWKALAKRPAVQHIRTSYGTMEDMQNLLQIPHLRDIHVEVPSVPLSRSVRRRLAAWISKHRALLRLQVGSESLFFVQLAMNHTALWRRRAALVCWFFTRTRSSPP
jgi:hypothetical protein